MLLFLTFVASLAFAHAAYTTLPQTGYRAVVSRQCGASSALYRIKSHHNNGQEDRQWTLGCKSGYALTTSAWTGYLNAYDKPINYQCGANQVLTGLYSVYHTGTRDRMWKAKCSRLATSLRRTNCALTRYKNGWDGAMDWSVPSNRVITGFYSFHDNGKEDRLWRFYHCEIQASTVSTQFASLPITGYDASYTRACGGSSVLYQIKSHHDNGREDRQWTYGCKSGYTTTNPTWTGDLNNWDAELNYKCPANKVVTGVGSYHNNHKEDRRWKIRCSQLDSTVSLHSCITTDWINDWDSLMQYSVDSNRVIQGLYSRHDNGKEDRLWKIHHCSTCSTKKVYSAWGAWSACTKPCTGNDGVSGTWTRMRSCTNGNANLGFCSGTSCSSETQTANCNTQRCKVNGGYGDWSAFSACSATCGAGKKSRTRKCDNPAPAFGGAACVGPATESADCKLKDCDPCTLEDGVCRQGKCPSDEKKATKSKKKCKGLGDGKGKPYRCCIKK